MTSRLSGRKIIITRTREQSGELLERLRREGADVAVVSAIEIEIVASRTDAENSLRGLDPTTSWIAFTSSNCVDVLERLIDATALTSFRLAAIGDATRTSLEAAGLRVELQPGQANGKALAAALIGRNAKTVLLPQAENANPVLGKTLRAAGAEVRTLPLYRIVMPEKFAAELNTAIADGFETVILMSGSAAEHVVQAGGVLPQMHFVCAGATSAAAMRKQTSINPAQLHEIPDPSDYDALVACLEQIPNTSVVKP